MEGVVGKETTVKAMGVRETGGNVSGGKATGVQVNQETGGKGGRLMSEIESDNRATKSDKSGGQNVMEGIEAVIEGADIFLPAPTRILGKASTCCRSFARGYDIRCIVFTVQRHKHTDDQFPGDNYTSKMANVRGLLVLSLVCLLLYQMMSPSEACRKRRSTKDCRSSGCTDFCCPEDADCHGCVSSEVLLSSSREIPSQVSRRQHDTCLRATVEYMKAPCTSYDQTTYSFY
ncbi:hypothetical protein LSAT2_028193 [Lamellibrachia satsuma]|nr:hypothetical protein LSAT2_028193 [Lamellibrachia satsuma]